MECPVCQTEMVPPGPGGGRYWCTCGRVAAAGETAVDIEIRERMRRETLDLLDHAIALRGGSRAPSLKEDPEMGQQMQTRGCSACGGTMYKTVEVDENNQVTGESQFVCSNSSCGNVE
ncbi:hypothetical protein [Streptomyces inhibens]|uniref:hypothetical protein n=1 Tax=Streptomyces inhibens TaxID=2293571 RepID=UPI001EE74604|nr:hypothetical protein [Streptomyces inhibens]UKY54877.1 hypothetical protein KI385_43010 [Streptomyces inhibens]